MKILLRFIQKANAYEQWRNLPLYFADSSLVCKEKLDTLKDGIHLILNEKTRKPRIKMTDIYQSLFGETFQAHYSLEDVVSLNRIMCSNELDVKDSDVVKYSISFSTAIKYVGFLEEKKQFMNNSTQAIPEFYPHT